MIKMTYSHFDVIIYIVNEKIKMNFRYSITIITLEMEYDVQIFCGMLCILTKIHKVKIFNKI